MRADAGSHDGCVRLNFCNPLTCLKRCIDGSAKLQRMLAIRIPRLASLLLALLLALVGGQASYASSHGPTMAPMDVSEMRLVVEQSHDCCQEAPVEEAGCIAVCVATLQALATSHLPAVPAPRRAFVAGMRPDARVLVGTDPEALSPPPRSILS
ncbi:hypothetical protein J2R99_000026 [Rhodopseudomonas julia]|uniref:Uncharacterized protein n=1 Tax=Rhodopseudomonas julia TaxID=200617 RepID=A0ABU0C0X3_9BRAD|nr:hypothetical protein [Rhodopseudomonas julia]